jgi:signal peptidase I
MTKSKSAGAKPRSASAASVGLPVARPAESPAAGGHHLLPSPAALRETIESVAIAFILAFLFRTFEAEAFVIPTGSMAPTLMGRHKDVICPKCGCPYQVSASEEVNSDGSAKQSNEWMIVSGTCPMCRYTAPLEKDTPYNGDRILVNKFAYEVEDPKRWDVIVFKYPGDPLTNPPSPERTDSRTNFIKRLVGLPGDTIRIEDGDVWLVDPKDKGEKAAKSIVRKPAAKLLAMLQPVFDNDYMPRIAEYGWPARWYPESASGGEGGAAGAWQPGDSATFSIDGTGKGEQWLRYHHRVPMPQQWQQVEGGLAPAPIPQLITDFTAYDTGKTKKAAEMMLRSRNGLTDLLDVDGLGIHWVGDLAVECTAEVESPSGSLVLELRKGGRQFLCRFELSTGKASFSISGRDMADWQPTSPSNVLLRGSHKIIFSNCDKELRLWVDGHEVAFDKTTAYDRDLQNANPDAGDLEPVGIASVGARVKISHLRVLRDIYYIADRWESMGHDVWYQYGEAIPNRPLEPRHEHRYVQFSLAKDQFFALGDNSAKSKDGRLWGSEEHNEHCVPRDLLIGKAMFIYWPHSWNRIPYVNIPFPFFPNFSRMGLVR